MASPKQVNYAMMLMRRAGYGTQYMRSEHKALGAGMSDRQGTVEGWLRNMSVADASALIDRLRGELGVEGDAK